MYKGVIAKAGCKLSVQVAFEQQPGLLEETVLCTQKHSIKNVKLLPNIFQPNLGLVFDKKKERNVPMAQNYLCSSSV